MIASQENSADAMANFLQDNKQFNPIEHVDYDFRSAAHVACVEGRLETIDFLSKQCQSDDFQRMIHREDRWGLSPLDEAFRHGHTNICHFIHEHLHIQSNQEQIIRSNSIEINIRIDLFRKWKKIYLFLTLAASGDVDRIKTLFTRGYFLRTELYADYHGRNPMHFAAANGHWNVIEFLLQYQYEGALHSNRWGYYPIDEARQKKFDHIVHQLTQLQC